MIFTRDLGTFDSLQAVWTAYPSGGQTGDYLNVHGRIYYWDSTAENWVCYSVQKPSARGAEVFNGDVHVGNNLSVGGILDARVVRGRDAFCGLFATTTVLNTYCPKPLVGQWALVITGRPSESMSLGKVYYCETEGTWTDAGYESDVAGIIGQLMGETTARETADQALQENIDTEATAREDADLQEAQTRQDGDDILQDHINAEARARQEADETLQEHINAEARARQEADETLQEHINAEARARQEADETLQEHINAEARARQEADETLQQHIDENDYAVMTDAEMDAALGTTPIENKKFNWDFNIFKRFYNNYVVSWLNGAMNWSAAQMKQARANLGFGNGDIEEKPVAGSHNPVESGGVAEEIALGAVFDVTAHNNNASFVSLSQLLHYPWLDDLIPAAVRKGGMSIKFVRRRRGCSDEYVQYRLMSKSFSTDPKDWVSAECELKDGEVTTQKLRDSAVTPEKLSPEVLISLLYDIGVDADGTLWVILGNPKGVDIPDEDWQRMSFHDYHERRVMVARDLEDEVCPVELQESGECTVIYENAGDEEYTVSISPRYKTAEGENVTLTVPVGGYAEVSYLKSGGVVYVRGV